MTRREIKRKILLDMVFIVKGLYPHKHQIRLQVKYLTCYGSTAQNCLYLTHSEDSVESILMALQTSSCNEPFLPAEVQWSDVDSHLPSLYLQT